jgi:hypothetical protein
LPPDEKDQKKKAQSEPDAFSEARPILEKLIASGANITTEELDAAMRIFIEGEKRTIPSRPEPGAPAPPTEAQTPRKGLDQDAKLVIEVEQRQRKRDTELKEQERVLAQR